MTAPAPYLVAQAAQAGGVSAFVGLGPSASTTPNGDEIHVAADASSGTIITVTDTEGNAYRLVNTDTNQVPVYHWVADALANPGGVQGLNNSDVVTVQFSSTAATKCVTIFGQNQGLPSPSIDAAALNSNDNAGSASMSVASSGQLQPVEVAIAIFASGNGGGSPTLGGGWTQLGSPQHTGTGQWLTVAYQILSSTTAVTATATVTSTRWGALITPLLISPAPLADTGAAKDSLQVGAGTPKTLTDQGAQAELFTAGGAGGSFAFLQDTTVLAKGIGQATPDLDNPSSEGSLLIATMASQGSAFTAPQGWKRAARTGQSRTATLIGLDVARGTWPAADAVAGPGQTHRIFYPPGTPLPSTFDPDGTPDYVTMIVSYKQQTTNVARYVSSIPDNRNVILIYHHEPEGDYATGAAFVAEFKAQSNLIRAQGRSNVLVGMCSAGYPYRTGGDSEALAGNYLRGLGAYVDVFTKDIYQGSGGASGPLWPSNGLANYDQFQNWLAKVTSPSVVGQIRPLGITEYGIYGAVTNTQRNTRLALDIAYLQSTFPVAGGATSPFPLMMFCYWWQTNTSPPTQFTDATTIATWQGIENDAGAQAEVWYYPNNPGGVTSATFTTAEGQLVRAGLIELSGNPNITQRVDTTAVLTQGSSIGAALTAALASPAGDAAVLVAVNHLLPPASGRVWGRPADNVPGPVQAWTRDYSLASDQLSFWTGNKTGLPALTLQASLNYADATGDQGWAALLVVFGQAITSPFSLSMADEAGAVEQLAITTETDQGAAVESITVSETIPVSAADTAAVSDRIDVINTSLLPWAVGLQADGSTSTMTVSNAVAAGINWQAGQQFQLYSGSGRVNSNESFESGTSPWTAVNGATLTQSTLNPNTLDLGTHSALVTPNGTTAQPGMQSEQVPIRQGSQYGLTASVVVPAGWASGAQVQFIWYDSSHTFITASTITTGALSSSRVTVTMPPTNIPAGAAFVQIKCQANGGVPANTILFYWDICLIFLVSTLLQPQVFTITNVTSAFGFTTATFAPAATAATVRGNIAEQLFSAASAQFTAASPAFVKSQMPRMHLQDLLTRQWLHRDVQGISSPLITWTLNQADSFTCNLGPPRPDLLDSSGNILIREWRHGVYLEENDEIKFGGIITGSQGQGPLWSITAMGFAGYPNGMPYEGDVFKSVRIDALDATRFLWGYLQSQLNGNLLLEMGSDMSGYLLGNTSPVPAKSELASGTIPGDTKIILRDASGFQAGMVIAIQAAPGQVQNPPGPITGAPTQPENQSDPSGRPHIKIKSINGSTLRLDADVAHFHKAGAIVTQVVSPAPYELDWWNSTDIGQEISSIQAEAIFDFRERHFWDDPKTKNAVRHQLLFGVPRVGARRMDLRFAEGENIVVPTQVTRDGSTYANNIIGLGAGQGRKTLRTSIELDDNRIRRTLVYTDQTIKSAARLQSRILKVAASVKVLDTPTTVVVINHDNARFGTFIPGDDILIRLASGWRNAQIWARITAMTQDPTTNQMTLTLARSDSFTYVPASGEAGTV